MTNTADRTPEAAEPRVLRREEFTTEGGITFTVTVTAEPKKAKQLNSDDVFTDGAMVLRLSFQLNWIYAYVVKGGRPLRRRFRYEQDVTVEKSDYVRKA